MTAKKKCSCCGGKITPAEAAAYGGRCDVCFGLGQMSKDEIETRLRLDAIRANGHGRHSRVRPLKSGV